MATHFRDTRGSCRRDRETTLTAARLMLLAATCTTSLTSACPAFAQGAPTEDAHGSGVHIELPVVDLPFNGADGFTAPSMAQSLATTADLYSLAHFGIGALVDPWGDAVWKRVLGRVAIGVFDAATFELPLLGAWQHEEWHRAVMSHRRVRSYNEIYDLHLFSSSVSVSRVLDADLERLTNEHPSEAVRLYAAGIEANYELATRLEKTQFFQRARTYNSGMVAVAYAVNTIYWAACADVGPADVVQPADSARRDFVGPDCTGWAYDLFHPGQPYAMRGVDPNGGVQRYQTTEATAATGYLSTQLALSLLNFLDPNIAGYNAFTFGTERPVRFNAHVRHLPTSFGTDTTLELFFQRGDLSLFGGPHAYLDQHYAYRPGISLEVIRYPVVRRGWLAPLLTMRADLWLQPSTTRIRDGDTAVPGGRTSLRLTHPVAGPLEVWVEGEGKTAGWAAGTVALAPAVNFRAGISASLFR